ncbi:MAG: ABC transporter ATP-binding protein [Paracoccus sp. (in: a-proteobacteria)]|nr:ABC transporter ATP-binding protein [Paracoccus sp. (in: a-proteobacteria)]
MIQLENLTKVYVTPRSRKVVADRINAVFPTGSSVALMGRNGAGKSSLLRMIAGTMRPSSGQVLSDGTISWPVGFAGSFHPELTGEQNVRFLSRVYGIDTAEMTEFVKEFAELGQHFYVPFRTYSSGMRSRLAFGASMAVPFDTYLVDEVTAVGDASFRAKSNALFLDRMQNASAIVVSHSPRGMREICTSGALLDNGRLTYYPDLEEAIEAHARLMGVASM